MTAENDKKLAPPENAPVPPQPDKKGRDMSSTSPDNHGSKARGDAAEGKDDPNTENDGDNGPGSD